MDRVRLPWCASGSRPKSTGGQIRSHSSDRRALQVHRQRSACARPRRGVTGATYRIPGFALVALLGLGAMAAACGSSPTTPPSPTPLIGSTTGQPPSFAPPDVSWNAVPVAAAGVLLKIPGDWNTEAQDTVHLVLRPPTSAADAGSPIISVTLLPDATLESVHPPGGTDPARTVTVNGFQGWTADDPTNIPPYSRYLALQLPSGVLYLQAYRGPGVDLSQFLDAVVTTITANQ